MIRSSVLTSVLSLCLAFSVVQTPAMASSACGPSQLSGGDIDFMIASISIVRAGLAYQESKSADAVAEQLCNDLLSVDKPASAAHPGYVDLTLTFKSEVCKQTLLFTPDGRVAKTASPVECQLK